MKTKLNKIGKLKITILALVALPNLLVPIAFPGEMNLLSILFPIIFGSIIIPFIAFFNSLIWRFQIVAPIWNENPLLLKKPLNFFHFGSFFFIIVGTSMILGSLVKFQFISFYGITSIAFGIGILIGIWITLLINKITNRP